uniref:Cytochrome b n=1 Tax=Trichuris rhinopiptheroxella TaxID=2282176 RepID=A0A346HH56_9BILA|nr:cytochrome b [Trichuris rhinopiptheroxella]
MKKLTYLPGLAQVLELPTPWNISFMWNLGSFLGMTFGLQLISGFMLVFYYVPSEMEAFDSIVFMMREVKFGVFMRLIHLNGASLVFILMYMHMVKALLNSSFNLVTSWLTGNMILLLTIVVAFMGYVLPWGNMGFWAATVITSFLSAVPIFGEFILKWIWGGFSISGRTLQFFFTLHYLLPFFIMSIAIVHILLLHHNGSSNPLGSHSPLMKIKFYPFFTSKDLLNFCPLAVFFLFVMVNPYWSSDPENFSYADRLASPLNIQPEWYFLPFYALLRSSNNKLGGLMLMVLGIFMFWFLPSYANQDLKNFLMYMLLLWIFFFSVLTLGWIASWNADAFMSLWLKLFTIIYFMLWMSIWLMTLLYYVVYS